MRHSPEAAPISHEAISFVQQHCKGHWLRSGLRNHDHDDCTQIVLTELLRRLTPEEWGEISKPGSNASRMLSTTVNLAKKRAQRDKFAHMTPFTEEHEPPVDADHLRTELYEEIEAAAQELSRLQRTVLAHALRSNSNIEIARETGMAVERVEDAKHRSIQNVRMILEKRGPFRI